MYQILHGDLWFSRSKAFGSAANARICGANDEIAVAYDKQDGTLLKHGTASAVRAYVESFRSHLDRVKFPNPDDFEMIVVAMPVTKDTVAELNACIETTGRVATIVDRLSSMAPSANKGPLARLAVPA